MNDKDKEEFDKWFNKERRIFEANEPATFCDSDEFCMKKGWQAACEYMRNKSNPLDALSLYEKLERERFENKKLREALRWYANLGLCDGYAKNLLKEVNEE